MTDPTITIGLASLAVVVTLALQALRATHYDGKLDRLKVKLTGWMQQIENELKAEERRIIAQASPDPSIEKIVEVASQFSAVKEMDQRVGELHTSNERSIRSSIVVILLVIGVAAALLFTTDMQQIETGIFIGTVVWLGSVYYVHRFIGEYNELCEKERKRQVP